MGFWLSPFASSALFSCANGSKCRTFIKSNSQKLIFNIKEKATFQNIQEVENSSSTLSKCPIIGKWMSYCLREHSEALKVMFMKTLVILSVKKKYTKV